MNIIYSATETIALSADDGIDDARQNREAIEASLAVRDVVLPRGRAHLDRAVFIDRRHNGRRLIGDRTVLVNSHPNGAYPHNNTLAVTPERPAIGYAENYEAFDRSAKVVRYPAGTDMSVHVPGCSIYLFGWNSYLTHAVNVRATVEDVNGTEVLVRDYAPQSGWVDGVTTSKYTLGYPVSDVLPGDTSVDLVNPSDNRHFTVGQSVYLTNGASGGNEAVGVWLRVHEIASDGLIVLDGPIPDGYEAATLVPMDTVEDVRFEGIEFGRPAQDDTNVFVKWCRDIAFVDCGWPDSRRGGSFVSGSGLKLLDSRGGVALLNSVRDVQIKGGTVGGVWSEERCADVDIADVLIRQPGGTMFGVAFAESKRMKLRNSTIDGIAAGGQAVVGGMGGGCLIRDVTIRGRAPIGFASLQGDGWTIDGLDNDLTPIAVQSGTGCSIRNVRGPLWLGWPTQVPPWPPWPPSGGRVDNCNVQRVYGGEWVIDGARGGAEV